ncbi:MAG TPA: S9 family peptidase [Dongiaceae bacterium]|nr:S9 family peptidase [Dongiaceae bacterium]
MQVDLRGTELYRRMQAADAAWLQLGKGRISDLYDIALSPDGRTIAASGILAYRLESSLPQRVCLLDVATGRLDVLSTGPGIDSQPKWSPDGRTLAFLSDRDEAGIMQLCLMDLASREETRPRLDGLWIEYAHWSPDGRRVLVGAARRGVDLSGYQGGYTFQPVDPLLPDWMPQVDIGIDDSQWRSLWVYDVAQGAFRRISPDGVNPWEACWAGEGSIACIASDGPHENHWYRADIRIIDLASGRARPVYRPKDQIGWLSASPDGSRLAVVNSFSSDRHSTTGELTVIAVADGAERRIETNGIDATFTHWQSDTDLLFAGIRSLESALALCDTKTGRCREIWTGTETTLGGERYFPFASPGAAPGDCAVTMERFFAPQSVAVFEDGKLRNVATLGPTKAEARLAALGRAEPYRWTAQDGLEICGWLLRPAKPGPRALIVDVHGGPVWSWRPACIGRSSLYVNLLEDGYAIFQPNPRGSTGLGLDFCRKVAGDMGGGDTQDILAGLDRLVADGIADPKRIGVTGISYGGIMAAWIITQDQRFAASVVVSPMTNYVSAQLTCNIPAFCENFLLDDYKRPGGEYHKWSAVMFADRVKTPTMNICGTLDHCCPAGQAIEFHNALLQHGVRSVLVQYPQEGHWVQHHPAIADYGARVAGWFHEHMPPN